MTVRAAVSALEVIAIGRRAPPGFKGAYERAARDAVPAAVLRDLLGLVGYDVSVETLASWPLERRVEAEVHAVNVHLRASDNKPMRRHPKPAWMPEPWSGEPVGEGVFESPGGTLLDALETQRAS